jgi:hypothetical protein
MHPRPESAKLFHGWILSAEHQDVTRTRTTRKDLAPPTGYPDIMEMPGTDPKKFSKWMSDRAGVERLRFFEDGIGSAQGLSPLEDDL